MELKKITDKIFYCSHEAETDRPMLVYLNGDTIKMVIDAGASKAHVDEFYEALTSNDLKLPDYTVLTHWHWDHSFGLHATSGLSIAHINTNKYLKEEQERLKDPEYIQFLKTDNPYFLNEYNANQDVIVSLVDIEFDSKINFDLGNMKVEIFNTIAPHTDDTALIYLSNEKILFLGDATSEDFLTNSPMDFKKLNKLIECIEEIDCQYCVVSHEEPLTKLELLTYLKSLI